MRFNLAANTFIILIQWSLFFVIARVFRISRKLQSISNSLLPREYLFLYLTFYYHLLSKNYLALVIFFTEQDQISTHFLG